MSAISGAIASTPTNTTAAPAAAKPSASAHQGLSFGDLLDIVNPLQHIPIVNTLYRKLTGDEMSPTAEIAGGALFGGIVGAASSIADVLFTQATGKNFGDTVFAWLGFEDKNPPVQLAKAQTAPAQTAPAQTASAQTAKPGIASSATLARPPVQTIRPVSFVAPSFVTPATPRASAAATPAANKFIDNLIKQKIDPATAARAEFAYRSALGLKIDAPLPNAPGF